ncbi:MAG: hypothetical protein AAF658_12920, partial [Myxococcota bacterium]
SGRFTTQVERCIGLELKNTGSRVTYFYLFALDPDMAVSLVFPGPDEENRMGPNDRQVIPLRTREPAGETTFKLLATSEPINGGLLEFYPRDLRRSAAKGVSGGPLDQLLGQLGGVRTRSAARVRAPAQWATSEAVLVVNGK